MKAMYLKAPYQFECRDVSLRAPERDEVIVRIRACGFCGHDLILARYAAKDWQPFGHEFSGVVEEIGAGVTNVAVGDEVAIETSTFSFLSDEARNGHPEQDVLGPSYMNMQHTAMGFAERTVVPACLCIKTSGIPFEQACFLEPMGVAYDLALTADIQLGDDVLVMGLGSIGLMALQMARRSGARRVYAADRSYHTAKLELAKEYGADEIICTDEVDLAEYPFARGRVDRVLVTTPPSTIDVATRVANVSGIVAFLGISYGDQAMVAFDSNVVHLKKLQIRASNAIPALYFPRCIDLLRAGLVDVSRLVTHTFSLEHAADGLTQYIDDRESAIKAVMINTAEPID
ncbi:MAG: alcohol dehydrogenase catalytic domain-containing protein [Christensenella sp.]|nr:alcohol dehydrogenase catalytic domain-containing protein [Christensenella sp.]